MDSNFAIIGPKLNGKVTNLVLNEFQIRNIQPRQLIPSKTGISVTDDDDKISFFPFKKTSFPKIALVRGVGSRIPSKIFYRLDWMRMFESAGVRLVNSRECLELATNKMITSQLLKQNHIPTPETILCEIANIAEDAFSYFEEDIIIKPLYRARGRGIQRIMSQTELRKIIRQTKEAEAIFYIQPFLRHKNEDIRILVVGDEIVGSMKRKSDNWMTNLAQGGQAIPFKPPEEYKEYALKASRAVKGEIIGVDLMETTDGVKIIEVNAVPGFLGLQSVTKKNIAQSIVDYLLSLV